MKAEIILTVPRAKLFAGQWPQGFLPASQVPHALAQIEREAEATPRAAAEADSSRKQPIPYCLVTSGTERVFCVRRRQAGSEARLHGVLSLGIGGHVHPTDRDAEGHFLDAALQRELREELHLPPDLRARPQWLGLINDDSSPVGQVHVGVASWLDVGDAWPRIAVRETSKLAGGFESLVESADLWQDARRFESWSWILLEAWRLSRQRAGQNG